MAVIPGNIVNDGKGGVTVTWTAVTTSDSGGPVDVSQYTEKTIHVVGSGNAQLQGSNDGTNFVSIGAALAANTLTQMTVNPRYLKFSTIAVATVTIILVARRGGL